MCTETWLSPLYVLLRYARWAFPPSSMLHTMAVLHSPCARQSQPQHSLAARHRLLFLRHGYKIIERACPANGTKVV